MAAPSTDTTYYVRFSSTSFTTIRERHNLLSDDLVIGVIEAAVLEIVNRNGFILVRCSIAAA